MGVGWRGRDSGGVVGSRASLLCLGAIWAGGGVGLGRDFLLGLFGWPSGRLLGGRGVSRWLWWLCQGLLLLNRGLLLLRGWVCFH